MSVRVQLNTQIMNNEDNLVPNEVVDYMIKDGLTAIAAWRRYLGFSQQDVADNIGVTRAIYAQMERAETPRKATLAQIAVVFGITPALLDI